MKKILFIILMVLLVGTVACGQTIQYRDTAQLSWDVVTQTAVQVGIDGGGEPIIEDVQTVEYEIFREPYPIADRAIGTMLGTTALLAFDIVVPADDLTYAYGVRTIYTTVTSTVVYSTINWSDVNGVATPDPFLYRRLDRVLPRLPLGLAGN